MGREAPICKSDPRIMELAEVLKTLADPNRLRIICYLSKGESCVCEIKEELGISQQLTSHHVHVLLDAGLLKLRREGTRCNYSIDRDFLACVCDAFNVYLDPENVACGRQSCFSSGK